MSTVPGPEAWRDAGLAPVEPDEPRRLGDEEPAPGEHAAEDYDPAFPRAFGYVGEPRWWEQHLNDLAEALAGLDGD